jgi:phosphate starvation-inducible protein PhoH
LCKTHRVPIGMVEFTSDDIVRSDMTRRLVKAFEQDSKYGNRTPASK